VVVKAINKKLKNFVKLMKVKMKWDLVDVQ